MKHTLLFGKKIRDQLSTLIYSKTIFLLLSFIFYATKNANAQDTTNNSVEENLLYRVGILIVAMVFAWISRGVSLLRMNSLMKKRSKKAKLLSPDLEKGKEVPAAKKLTIVELDAETQMEKTKTSRDKLVEQAKKGFRRLFFTDLIVIASYFILVLCQVLFFRLRPLNIS